MGSEDRTIEAMTLSTRIACKNKRAAHLFIHTQRTGWEGNAIHPLSDFIHFYGRSGASESKDLRLARLPLVLTPEAMVFMLDAIEVVLSAILRPPESTDTSLITGTLLPCGLKRQTMWSCGLAIPRPMARVTASSRIEPSSPLPTASIGKRPRTIMLWRAACLPLNCHLLALSLLTLGTTKAITGTSGRYLHTILAVRPVPVTTTITEALILSATRTAEDAIDSRLESIGFHFITHLKFSLPAESERFRVSEGSGGSW